jgi:hypothetical protein
MSDEAENEGEVEGEHYMKVPMAHYNSLVDAADLGFEVLVQRRNDLRAAASRVPLYPERDSAKMGERTSGVLDGVPLTQHDIQTLERGYAQRIGSLAQALNHRLHSKRYS